MKTEAPKIVNEAECRLLIEFINQCRAPRKRTFREFVREEIFIPNGPFKGLRFDFDFQPFVSVWADLIDADEFIEYNCHGPVQSGKTFNILTIVLMYYLFEIEEDCIFGVPKLDMAETKWRKDILPVIKRSRYAKLLPEKGAGSRGGVVKEIEFTNGVILRFVSGAGGDEERSGDTARVIFITELDKFVKVYAASKETDPVTQIEARSDSFDKRARKYKECTISSKQGRIYQDWTKATRGSIVNPCPQCSEYILWGREHLVGWKEAKSKHAAKLETRWECPHCKHKLDEAERHEANRHAVYLCEGQTIDKSGTISGARPETDACGFRYNAFHNMFRSTGDIGGREWENAHYGEDDSADTSENKEKYLQQFVYAIPYTDPGKNEMKLQSITVRRSQRAFTRGILPPETMAMVTGIDIGKWRCHWVNLAILPNFHFHIADYGIMRPQPVDNDVEAALKATLNEYYEIMINGYPVSGTGEIITPRMWGIDARYETDAIMRFCESKKGGVYPTMGFGGSSCHGYTRPYKTPGAENATIHEIGNGYHVELNKVHWIPCFKLNADYWKSRIHQEYMRGEEDKKITLFKAAEKEHTDFSRHIVSEHPVEIWDPVRGHIEKWERVKDENHYLDALGIARAIAEYVIADGMLYGKTNALGEAAATTTGAWFKK